MVAEKIKIKKNSDEDKLMAEGYQQLAKLNLEIEDVWKFASSEAEKLIGDY